MQAHALSQLGTRWKAGAVALAASVVLMSSFGAGTSEAWYCSNGGFRPWKHYSYSHSNGIDHF